ncbi:MAG TPA: Re/Si-specific NAD(P)(+) transhydrogenase subunit alpha [Polyangia bacterium]
MLKVLIAKEWTGGEARVAATPETVKRLVKEGLEVAVEPGAGEAAYLLDERYQNAGARLTTDLAAEWATADAVFKVSPLGANPQLGKNGTDKADEAAALKPGALVISFLQPYRNLPMVNTLVAGKITSLAMELVPRITRAQSMDALSSQANIAGYKAVLLAASHLGKYFPMLMTAAGTIPPAKVVIMGAGVAGLQAVATAKRLGAVVWVSDVRPVVKEQVESLGGKFIDLPPLPTQESGEGQGGYAKEMSKDFLARQQAIIQEHITTADVVITTALIPGKPAPRLVTAEMVRNMRPGSVIVDLAAEQGGNCELTAPDQVVSKHGVAIVGYTNLPSTMPLDASTLYARNVLELALLVFKGGKLNLNLDDEIIKGVLLTHDGQITHGPTALAAKAAP